MSNPDILSIQVRVSARDISRTLRKAGFEKASTAHAKGFMAFANGRYDVDVDYFGYPLTSKAHSERIHSMRDVLTAHGYDVEIAYNGPMQYPWRLLVTKQA